MQTRFFTAISDSETDGVMVLNAKGEVYVFHVDGNKYIKYVEESLRLDIIDNTPKSFESQKHKEEEEKKRQKHDRERLQQENSANDGSTTTATTTESKESTQNTQSTESRKSKESKADEQNTDDRRNKMGNVDLYELVFSLQKRLNLVETQVKHFETKEIEYEKIIKKLKSEIEKKNIGVASKPMDNDKDKNSKTANINENEQKSENGDGVSNDHETSAVTVVETDNKSSDHDIPKRHSLSRSGSSCSKISITSGTSTSG